MRRAKATHCAENPGYSAGLLRGTGDGTIGRFAGEQERPSWVVLDWTIQAYKAEAESARCPEGVRGVRTTDDREDSITSPREGALP